MKTFLFCLLVIVFLSGMFTPAHALIIGNHSVTIDEVTFGHRRFSVVTMVAREADAGIGRPAILSGYHDEFDYVPTVLKYIQTWVRDNHVLYGTFTADSKLFRDFETIESLIDDRSSIIFITEYNNIAEIKATMRVTWRGTSQYNFLHPAEQRLGQKNQDGDYELIRLPDGRLVVEGESLEWKNLIKVKDPSEEFDFISLLYWQGLRSGVFEGGFRRYKWKGISTPLPLIPRYITGECTPRLHTFHTSTWGFNSVFVPEHETYRLWNERRSFLSKLNKHWMERGGPQLNERIKIKQVLFEPALNIPKLKSPKKKRRQAADTCNIELNQMTGIEFFIPSESR